MRTAGFLMFLLSAYSFPQSLNNGIENPGFVLNRPITDSLIAPEYKIGTGMAKVTDPAIGIGMQGMSDDKQRITGLELHLYSRAFIIEHIASKKRVVLVNADIWSATHALKKEVLRQLQLSYGRTYTMENVLISGTHNHSGPGGFSHYYLYNHSMRGFDSHNFACIVAGLVHSIRKAHNNLAPGRIYMNKGEIPDCGRNRSLAAYNNNPQSERNKYSSETDKNMLLLKFVKIIDTIEKPVGVLNWYALHPTDRGQKNTRVCGDNKGYASYLFEREMRTNYAAGETFVAAFANSSAGDVSGNVEFGEIPDGRKDISRMQMHGRKQFIKARQLYDSAREEIRGTLDYRHTFVDMVSRTGAPGALGLSMFAGSTEDSNPGSHLKEGITENNISATERAEQVAIASLFVVASGVPCPTVANLNRAQVNAHLPKPITLAPGVTNPLPGFPKFAPLTPTILPFQLIKIGQLAITALPAEFTTMSGRRMQNAMIEELDSVGVRQVALATYANDYSQYVTTEQEYQKQHYEGASTLFGPQSLNTYLAEFRKMARAIRTRTGVAPGSNPPDLSRQLKRIPRITVRNLSRSRQTLYFYNHNDFLMFIEFSKKSIPANSELAIDLARPNEDWIASGRTKAKVVLNGNKGNVPIVSNGQLIVISAKGTIRVTSYTPPPR